ncbi:DUF2905 domain-containing protein [Paenibacillus sambharensis]|uniref:DUF2905 domain-containing protein n=1 Tax=Paenibacillus sambharensis TaxID=1803190 RepID=A0A2W1LPD6_9BACL|nr:DUF2905 domain-containing protein [Paenibacillus sambharensis]PZD93277.1 DUF2905 domain-containing protein [Paenibacillus sambharensis]
MNQVPKLLMMLGAILFAVGLLWMLIGRYIPLGRLPGDIAIEKENIKFYFPIVTCIIISVVLSLAAYLVRLFLK